MTEPLHLLLAAGIVRRTHAVGPDAHTTLELGDQLGLLDPAATEPLVAAVDGLLPEDLAGLATGDGRAEILLAYLLGRARRVPLASIRNADGRIEVGGRLPARGPVWLLVTVLDDPATIAGFEAACRRAGAEPGGVVALVDRLPEPETRVRRLTRWTDHVHPTGACPVCGG
ncbi:MAG TPA: hypothetical protein VFD49_17235 [Candidatus Dormibacteraeota bacterium]|nr:hypothetical protein [Candidatus Dormibacteraeota bacterium]